MHVVGQRNTPILPLLIQEEKKLQSLHFLAEARKPNSPTSQLLDRAWKEIPDLTNGQEVVSTLKTCTLLANRLLKTPPRTLDDSYKFTFSDGSTLEVKQSQLQPLLADSAVLKTMIEGSFREGNRKEATLSSISKPVFEILVQYTHSTNAELLSPAIILDLLEAGCFLLNLFIIKACVEKLHILLRTKDWDSAINPQRLINLTLNEADMLKLAKINQKDLVASIENGLTNGLNSAFERLRNSTPSLFNFYKSSFDPMLKKCHSLVYTIQNIQTKLALKEKLNEIILRKVKQLHFDHNYQLLGSIENTIKILEMLIESGYPKETVRQLIKEYSDDLRYYHEEKKELMKNWSQAITSSIPPG